MKSVWMLKVLTYGTLDSPWHPEHSCFYNSFIFDTSIHYFAFWPLQKGWKNEPELKS